VGVLDAERLSTQIKNNPDLEVTIRLSCQNHPAVESFNLIADLKGQKYPDQIVLLAGHLDDWDTGAGAHDDGAGCIQVIEPLYMMKKLNLQPSGRFAVFFMPMRNKPKAEQKFMRNMPNIQSNNILRRLNPIVVHLRHADFQLRRIRFAFTICRNGYLI
jgi:carboxypeptidase Q